MTDFAFADCRSLAPAPVRRRRPPDRPLALHRRVVRVPARARGRWADSGGVLPAGQFTPAGSLAEARWWHTATPCATAASSSWVALASPPHSPPRRSGTLEPAPSRRQARWPRLAWATRPRSCETAVSSSWVAGGRRGRCPIDLRGGLGPRDRRVHAGRLTGHRTGGPHGHAPASRSRPRRGRRMVSEKHARLRGGLGPCDRRVHPSRDARQGSFAPHGHAPAGWPCPGHRRRGLVGSLDGAQGSRGLGPRDQRVRPGGGDARGSHVPHRHPPARRPGRRGRWLWREPADGRPRLGPRDRRVRPGRFARRRPSEPHRHALARRPGPRHRWRLGDHGGGHGRRELPARIGGGLGPGDR